MKFKLLPILDTMSQFYQMPPNKERFNKYISLLKGNSKKDLQLPISGFNPMAKNHIIDKIQELKELKAEDIIKEVLLQLNPKFKSIKAKDFNVAINIADDLKGGWTNHYTTDFDSKFKLNAFVNRGFCVPYFWSSELYSKQIIIQRTKEYIFRTVFWLKNTKIKTLKDYVKQERFVFKNSKNTTDLNFDLDTLKQFYKKNKDSEEYNLIFNFFYGDDICEKLNYPVFGIKEVTGFDFVKKITPPIS